MLFCGSSGSIKICTRSVPAKHSIHPHCGFIREGIPSFESREQLHLLHWGNSERLQWGCIQKQCVSEAAFLTMFRTRNSYKYQCTLAFSLYFVLKVFWEHQWLLPGAVVPESVDELQHCGGGWSAEQLGVGETWNVQGWGCALRDGLHHWWRFGHWIRHIWVGEVSFNHEYFLSLTYSFS